MIVAQHVFRIVLIAVIPWTGGAVQGIAFCAGSPVFRRSTRKFPSFLFSYFAHPFLRTSIFPIFAGIFQCPF